MSITVHIERLVLHDLPATSSKGPLVQAAVEAELTRLLATQGVSRSSGGAVAHLSAGSIEVAEDSRPAQLGYQIAQAIHGGIALAPVSRRLTRFGRGVHK